MTRKVIIPFLFIVIIALIAFWIFLLWTKATGSQAVVGVIAIPAAALVGVWQLIQMIFPEATKLFIAWLLRKIGNLPLNQKRRVIRNEVEANLKKALSGFDCGGIRVTPHPPKIEWTSEFNVSSDSFFRDGRIIVRLDYSDNPHRNIVDAALLYCKSGLIPETRHYLWDNLAHALDLVFVQAVMEQENLRDSALYFKQEILDPELDSNEDIEKQYDEISGLHEHGYFIRILLPELRDYAGRVHRADTKVQHKQWITNFIAFVAEAAKEHPVGTKRALDHIRKRFKVSIIIVGERWKVASQGQRPYLKRIALCANLSAHTVFIIGSSNSIPDIAKNAVKLGIADESECESYHTTWHGRIQRTWCARLDISEKTAASAMQHVEELKDWPDFETEAGVSEVQ